MIYEGVVWLTLSGLIGNLRLIYEKLSVRCHYQNEQEQEPLQRLDMFV